MKMCSFFIILSAILGKVKNKTMVINKLKKNICMNIVFILILFS